MRLSTIVQRGRRRIGAAVWAAAMMLSWLTGCADRLFYVPDAVEYDHPRRTGFAFEEVLIESEPGVLLHGYFFKPRRSPAKGAVVHVHGNAANVTNHFPLTLFLVEQGYQVLVFDYRGFGRSTGRLTRKGTLADTHAAIDYVKARDDVDPARVMLFGQSLGGAFATVAAAQRDDLRAVVIESAFTSYYAIARSVMYRSIIYAPLAPILPYLIFSPGMAPVDYVGRIQAPTLFVYSKRDQVIPWRMTHRLYELAREPKELLALQTLSHLGGTYPHNEKYAEPIVAFFDRAVSNQKKKKDR